MSTSRTRPRLALAFLLGLFLVGGLGWLPWMPEQLKLAGYVPENVRPPVTWATLRDGSLTRWLENEFSAHLAFRWIWIGIDRQLSYTAFGEIPSSGNGTRIVTAPGDWLFERNYIHHALHEGIWDEAEARAQAARWKRAQDTLDKLGVPLLLVVAPSKAEVYPEKMPAEYRSIGRPADFTTTFERLRPALNAARVRWYDAPGRFAQWKQEGKKDLFARSGSHWNRLWVAQIASELPALLNPVLRHPLGPVVYDTLPRGEPETQDLELLRTANLLLPRLHAHWLALPRIHPSTTEPGHPRPRILWVTDSFGWHLIDTLTEANAIQSGPALFYFKTTYAMPARDALPQAPADLVSAAQLRQYDAVIVVMTEIAVDFEGWGFLDAVDTLATTPESGTR